MSNKYNKIGIENINSNYILKNILSYIGFRKILKILKYNKKLHSKLDIKITDYENESNIPKYEYIDKSFSYHKYQEPFFRIQKDGLNTSMVIFLIRIFYLLAHLYYRSIYYLKSEDENIQQYKDTIIKIEKNSFGILFFNILYFILINNIFTYEFPRKFNIFDIRLYMISLSLLIIFLSYIIFFGLCLYRFILYFLIYGKRFDSLLIIFECYFYLLQFLDCWFTLLYILVFFEKNFTNSKGTLYTINKFVLNKFNNIQIIDYILPKNFNQLSKAKRKQLILYEFHNFHCLVSKEHFDLLTEINNLRQKNDIQELIIDKSLPLFSIRKYSDMEFNNEKNFFELIEFGNIQYIFKYPIGEFRNRFKNKGKTIINILLKDNIKYIQICSSETIEYIIFKNEKHKYKFVSYNDIYTFRDEDYKYHLIKEETGEKIKNK